MRRIRAVLIDIDGVLTVSWQPLAGAVAALTRLRADGYPVALVTNTTSRSRASIPATLAGSGFPVTAADILTAPVIAAAYLREHYPGARCLLLSSGDLGEDLAGQTLATGKNPAPADVMLLGEAGPEFSYQALNEAFGHLQRGAQLVAMHRGLYWRTSEGLQLDTGAFLSVCPHSRPQLGVGTPDTVLVLLHGIGDVHHSQRAPDVPAAPPVERDTRPPMPNSRSAW